MATLTTRSYAGDHDLQPIVDLLNLCDSVDQLDDNYAVEDLQAEFSDPRVDPANDLRIWEDADGQIAAFAQMWLPAVSRGDRRVDGYLYFRVHPAARGSSVDAEILAWGEARLREIGRSCGLPAHVLSGTRDVDRARLALLERASFAVERYFFTMERSLAEPIPVPHFPDGFTLRYVADDANVQPWVEAYNQSFIDHWNFHPMTVEVRQHFRTKDPNYVPEQDLIVVAPDGVVAAFCACYIDPAANTRNNRNEGWIHLLGTRRGFRRLGLGRAALLAGLQRLRADGVTTARLGVDAENPTGALGLYEAVGFYKALTWVTCGKDL